ncbi:Bax inhibitor-1/YccA family protein [Corynebacterium pacaense]|uniref:Bax inhibitor-1/YccA family protein n=1 Tax=Corynebacterium pacaense TaxID=1816684 RepID=UPI0009BB5937|nr:Bax inhibitor-1/YccA family protein [Corynebacterium pacaense]
MRSSNPVFSSLTETQRSHVQDPYGNYGAPQQRERSMTVDDVITKTGITLGVIIVFALVTVGVSFVNPGLAMILTIVGAIGGFITVLVSTFGKKYGSAAVTIIYAVFEGLFVGGISLLLSGWTVGNSNAGTMIGQAVLGTVGVFIGMLFVYKTGAIKVTPKFNRIITSMLVGVLVLALGNLVMAMFGLGNPLRDGGMLAIIFSLVCIGLAAFSFLTDFDAADRMVRQGVPANMAWGVALGLAVTLVWLYTEILRLLSYFRSN